jgi:hypothetical protein
MLFFALSVVVLSYLFSIEAIPAYRSAAWKVYEDRCSFERLAERAAKPAGLSYRDYFLCNAAALDEAAFGEASDQFKSYIDGEVRAYWQMIIRHIAATLGWAALIWIILVLSAWSSMWIIHG